MQEFDSPNTERFKGVKEMLKERNSMLSLRA